MDRSGRARRKRVYFREDQWGPIPYGPPPRSEGYRRARAALELLLEEQAVASRTDRPPPASVLDLVVRFRAECDRRVKAGEGLGERSARVLIDAIRAWADWPARDPIGYRPAASIRPEDLERWIEELLAAGQSRNYVRRLAGAVKRLWSWAAERELVPKDPMARVKRPRAPKGTGRRPDRLQWRRWRRARWGRVRTAGRKAERTTDRVFLLLLRAIGDTGARPDELCRARWSELDWDLLALVPLEHKTDEHNKVRAIFFPRRWRRALRWLREHGHPEFLFWHRQVRPRTSKALRRGDANGEPWTANALTKKARKWEMPCWPYDLRRLVASELADAGLDYRRIADLLGNSEELVRSVYVRRRLESLRGDFDRAISR